MTAGLRWGLLGKGRWGPDVCLRPLWVFPMVMLGSPHPLFPFVFELELIRSSLPLNETRLLPPRPSPSRQQHLGVQLCGKARGEGDEKEGALWSPSWGDGRSTEASHGRAGGTGLRAEEIANGDE